MRAGSRANVVLLVALAWGCGGAAETPATGESQGSEQAAPAEAEAPAAEAEPAEVPIVDPVGVSPEVYKVLLDSDRMRIVEATWQPGQRDKPHGHPALIAYGVTLFHGLSWADDGKQSSLRVQKGRAFYQEPVQSHSVENLGSEVAKVVFVELKPGEPPAPMPKDAAPDAMSASPDVYELVMLDSHVRVLHATWQPGQKDELHGHPALAAYALTDVKGKLEDAEGKNSSAIEQKAGTALFQDPVKAHTFQNVGDSAAELLLIEPRN